MTAKYAFDRERSFYRQSNNSAEELLRKVHLQIARDVRLLLEGKVDGSTLNAVLHKILSYLETCGPTSAVMCMAAFGRFENDPVDGALTQREDELTDFFNDPRNYARFRAVRDDVDPASIPGNRVPQYYPIAVKTLYGVRCEFLWTTLLAVVEHLKEGRTAQLCFKDPGHFFSAVAYDEERDEIVYNDPWPERYMDGNGFNRRAKTAALQDLVEPYALVYYTPV